MRKETKIQMILTGCIKRICEEMKTTKKISKTTKIFYAFGTIFILFGILSVFYLLFLR